MPKIKYAQRFCRQVERLTPKQQAQLDKKLCLFQEDPFQPTLKTHPLQGSLQGAYAFAISYDLRVIFLWENPARKTAMLIAIGTHAKAAAGRIPRGQLGLVV